MKFLQSLFKFNLFKISFYNAISLVVKLFAGFISSKAIAYFIGPSGLVLIANLRNLLSISENIGLMGLQNSLVIEVAQNKNQKDKLNHLLQTLFVFFASCSVVLVVLVLMFNSLVTKHLLLEKFPIIVILASFFIPFQIFHIYFLQILNGLEFYKKLYLTHIFGNIIYVIISVFLIWQFGILGGLYAVLSAPLVLFWVVFYYFKPIDKSFLNFKNFDFAIIKSLMPVTIMILFTTVFSQLITLEIRKFIISSCSINQAGYWEAMQRISSIYMLFFNSLITIYYLPKLSAILNSNEIKASKSLDYKKLVTQFYIYLVPLVFLTFEIIYLLKNEIVLLVLNKEFLQVTHLFKYQLIGDFFKIAASILALQFFIRKDTKVYLVLESISLILYLFSAYYFIENQQEVGATIGFAISNFVYFVLVVLVRLNIK